ncbi:MAG TPA: hypothetical protein VFZ01_08030, partial [Geminicoccaceae bacterium]
MFDRALHRLRVAGLAAAIVGLAGPVAAEGVHLASLEPGVPEPERAVRLVPGPLSEHDTILYGQIFELQRQGAWDEADRRIAGLKDPVLLGHVLYQRYMHPTAYRSTYAELKDWLDRYADHPDADRIHALALKRRVRGTVAPEPPLGGYLGGAGQQVQERVSVRYRSSRARSSTEEQIVRRWQSRIEAQLRRGEPGAALKAFEDQAALQLVDRVEVDLARWSIARGFFIGGQDDHAFRLAARSAERSGDVVPEIHWLAGISAWRLGRIGDAGEHFAILAEAGQAHEPERSRAAFWAAR